MNFVNEIINANKDKSLIDQVKILKEYKDNEEVKHYLCLLDECNLSPYMRWVVDKYLFERKVGKKPSSTNVKLFGIVESNNSNGEINESTNN